MTLFSSLVEGHLTYRTEAWYYNPKGKSTVGTTKLTQIFYWYLSVQNISWFVLSCHQAVIIFLSNTTYISWYLI